jgi:hypothetical protein
VFSQLTEEKHMLFRLIGFAIVGITFGSTLLAQSTPITAEERLHWLMRENLAPAAVLQQVVIAAEDTRVNSPKEYGPHWVGFGKRVGILSANYGVRTVMEAGLGSIWGEDPRYQRTEGRPFAGRIGHVFKMTFFAYNRAGNEVPAYARFLAIPGGNFLANTWMPDSEATVGDAAVRAGMGFLGRMGENAYHEFKPRK